jgi:hypothetical protein
MSRYLLAFLMGAALVGPVALRADDDRDRRERRYYDRTHKDYHVWNDGEDRAYRRFLEENRRENHSWTKASRREQEQYWRWRHEHRD